MSVPAALPTRRSSGGRRLLALMTALFALPFVVTALLFAVDWRPAQTGSHGELVAGNDVLLPFDGLLGADGKALPADVLAGRWTLLVADAGPCSADCRARLASVRQIHVALNKQMARVKRVWLSPAPAADPLLAELRASFPDLVVAAPATTAWQGLLPAPTAGARLYVIDPSGRTVLRYPENFEPRGALRDVERLLKYSWLG